MDLEKGLVTFTCEIKSTLNKSQGPDLSAEKNHKLPRRMPRTTGHPASAGHRVSAKCKQKSYGVISVV